MVTPFQIIVVLLLAGIAIILLCTRSPKTLNANGEEYKRLYHVYKERAEGYEKRLTKLADERNSYRWAYTTYEDAYRQSMRASGERPERGVNEALANLHMTIKIDGIKAKGASPWWKVA